METELMIRRRVFLLVVIVTGLFLALIGRVGYLTTARSAALTKKGVDQWTRDGLVYAKRGNIEDTKGQTLVYSVTAYIVSADPRRVLDTDAFLDAVCPLLSIDREQARKKLSDKQKASVILKRQVDRDTVDQLRQAAYSGEASLSALIFEEDVKRFYPRGRFLAQVLGLTNVDSVGQSGLELDYDKVLSGTPGRMVTRVDGRSQTLFDDESLYIEPQAGGTLRLTIDASIQEICEKAMRECYEVNKAKAVMAIVMDTQTGAILAMCQKPDYDPNDPPREDVAALTDLMRIRLISDAYEPGSTFKVLTAAAALDSGVTTPEDTFYCSGKVLVDGDTIRCWGAPHKAETMADGLRNSCNPVFVELALRLGQERFYQYMRAFGLGMKTQVDLQGEGNGILISAKHVKNVDLARIGFGQSVAVTPIQLLAASCAAVNGGRLMRPYIVKEVLSPSGETISRTSPKVVANPITQETSLILRGLLETVVSEGGAKNAAIKGYRIGGKTGTAQVYKDGKIDSRLHIGSFFGFAPADEPRFALMVIVSEADMPVDYGGTTAAPFARQIMADVLPYLGCQGASDASEQRVIVPDVIGLSLAEAKRLLTGSGLMVLSDGLSDQVVAQMPASGATLRAGGQVMLYTYEESPVTTSDLVCVPDVKGLSVVEAGRVLRLRYLQMEIAGSGVCQSQSPMAGSFVPKDSVVTATFRLPN